MEIPQLLQIKMLELDALFGITRAINANETEENLYKIFNLTVRSNLNISKLALFVKGEDGMWICKTSFGNQHDYRQIPLEPAIMEIEAKQLLPKGIRYFSEFYLIIPIKHKDQVLAYAFLGKADAVKDEAHLELDFLEAMTNILIVAIENKKLARKEIRQEEYRKQLDIAKNVQRFLFPKQLPQTDKLWVEASYLPHHTIGGDYYDFVQLDQHRSLLAIADVSGKGVPAALLMANFQAGMRVLANEENTLPEMVKKLNRLVYENSRGENFITAFFMVFDLEKKTLKYINAGHNPPFLFRGSSIMKRLETGTTILGGFKNLPFIHDEVLTQLDDFMVFCFTDGFTETYNDEEIQFGEDDLGKFIESHYGLSQKELHIKLIAHLNQFKGHQAYVDDITLYSCRVKKG